MIFTKLVPFEEAFGAGNFEVQLPTPLKSHLLWWSRDDDFLGTTADVQSSLPMLWLNYLCLRNTCKIM